jgi:hypothetical protein
MSPRLIPAAGCAVSTGANARTGSCRHDDAVARRASSGRAAPFSSGTMIPADRYQPQYSSSWLRSRLFLRWPQDASGSAQSLVPRGGGREKESRSVQSTASDVLASVNWSGMLASSRPSQTACSAGEASPSGWSLLRAAVTRPKVRSVCR